MYLMEGKAFGTDPRVTLIFLAIVEDFAVESVIGVVTRIKTNNDIILGVHLVVLKINTKILMETRPSIYWN